MRALPLLLSATSAGLISVTLAAGAAAQEPPPAPPAAADEHEWVTWNTGGEEADFGLGVFAHLGFGHRFNDSPLGDPESRNGLLMGITGLVRPIRHLALGVGYEHFDLGNERPDVDAGSFANVRRDLNTLWAQVRVYPVRVDPVALYLGLGAGPSWQSLDSNGVDFDVFSNTANAATQCSGNDGPGVGLRGGLGIEAGLGASVLLHAEAGADAYLLDDAVLDGCQPGSGNAYLFALRAGFAIAVERTKKAAAPLPPPPPAPPPPPPAPSDRDGDGVVDTVDACPDVAGPASTDPAKHGCPIPQDRDGDGVVDGKDACPDLAGVATADPLTNGCPPDTDGDGIRDDTDACKTEKGRPNADPTKHGCPLVQVTAQEIVINEQVQFEVDKATIQPVSFGLLDSVASVIKEQPQILKIEVQGHTDATGSKKHNTDLSKRRAESVKKALVERGVDAKRLDAKGYGPDQPIADHATAEGQAKNRRVQFKIMEKK